MSGQSGGADIITVKPSASERAVSSTANTASQFKRRRSTLLHTVQKLPSLGGDDREAAAKLSENAYMTELLPSNALRWVLLPYSSRRISWDLVTLVLVLYTTILTPLRLGFDVGQHVDMLRVIDVFSDVFFVCDIAINFNTAVINERDATLILDKRKIARHYASSWLLIDVAASVPWELISLLTELVEGAENTTGGLANVRVKVLKLPKLLRLGRLFKIALARFQGAATFGRIVLLFVGLLLLIHVLCAFWYLIIKDHDAVFLESRCAGMVSPEDTISQYLCSYYATTMVVLGDDIGPSSNIERIFVSGLRHALQLYATPHCFSPPLHNARPQHIHAPSSPSAAAQRALPFRKRFDLARRFPRCVGVVRCRFGSRRERDHLCERCLSLRSVHSTGRGAPREDERCDGFDGVPATACLHIEARRRLL